ncbi:MAG: hypothetical protein JST51_06070 [Armatimonadetes bacterium]|nr:hypothetical protein [Armatimonadota bacterium]
MRTESEIRALVAAFENHTLRYEEWTHAAHLSVAKFLHKKAILDHFSRERIMSIEARYGWVEPDLAPLPE